MEDVNYAKALYRAMIPLKMRWVGLSTTRIAEEPDLLKLAAQSGCKGLLIGFESVSQETLNGTHKGFHTGRRYGEVVKKPHGSRHRRAGLLVRLRHGRRQRPGATVEFVDA